MSKYIRPVALGVAAASAAALAAMPLVSASAQPAHISKAQSKHVLLISVDGMHQSDLAWFIAKYPHSTLANLVHHGVEYTNVKTSNPSDSDPGGTALMTGGNPKTTGVYYDVEYSHTTDEPAIGPNGPTGATCVPGKPATGGDVIFDSPDDALPAVPDFLGTAGSTYPSFDENGSIFPGGVDTNPQRIMNLQNSASSFNFATFPVNPKTCKSISPWDYLGDNTIFQVIHSAGMRTAWSDKHAVYMSFEGPGSGGRSIDDFFGPEIDSQAVMPNGKPYEHADGSSDDWAHIDAATKQYDGYKVQAIINEIDGKNHAGSQQVGTPAIFGMNFQTVSVAQKIPMDEANLIGPDANGNYHLSAPQAGGYTSPGVPGPVLTGALNYVNTQLGRMVTEIKKDGLANSTTIIITAKHGQSPTDPSKVRTIKDGPIIDAINAAWTAKTGDKSNLIVAGTDDDVWQSYLSDRSQAATDFVANYLMSNSAQGADAAKNPMTIAHSGVSQCWAGAQAAKFFGVSVNNGHYPDVFCEVQEGVIYTKPGNKLAEHGGMNVEDRHVLMVVSGPGIRHAVKTESVETAQVAPTVLALLGLNPRDLTAVKVEHTKVLPGAIR